jgi:hypothetical protein
MRFPFLLLVLLVPLASATIASPHGNSRHRCAANGTAVDDKGFTKSGSNKSPLPALLRQPLQTIRDKTRVAILLPSRLPQAQQTWHAVAEADEKSWNIRIDSMPSCNGANACFTGMFSATRGLQHMQADKEVQLARNITGYYRGKSCGGSCAPPQIEWEFRGALYAIQFWIENNNEQSIQDEIVGMANSAIDAGAR